MGWVGFKRCMKWLWVAIILLAVCPKDTQAQITISQPIRFAFSGTVTGYGGAYSLVGDEIAVSDTFSGYYDFNPDIPASPPSTPSYSNFGVYEFEDLAPAGMTMQLQIGGRTFTSSQPDHVGGSMSAISVSTRTYWFGWPSPATYSVESKFKDDAWDIRWGQMGFWLDSYSTNPPITSAALPLTPPDLSEFSNPFYAVDHFYFQGSIGPRSDFFQVVGRLDTLQLVDSGVSSQQAVPEPDAWLVAVALAVVVCFFVRVSRSNAVSAISVGYTRSPRQS